MSTSSTSFLKYAHSIATALLPHETNNSIKKSNSIDALSHSLEELVLSTEASKKSLDETQFHAAIEKGCKIKLSKSMPQLFTIPDNRITQVFLELKFDLKFNEMKDSLVHLVKSNNFADFKIVFKEFLAHPSYAPYHLNKLNLLNKACIRGNNEIAAVLIRTLKIDVNQPDSQTSWSPLHRACYKGNTHLVNMLLQNKNIDISRVDSKNKTGLYIALEENKLDIVRALISHSSEDLGKINLPSRSLLHFAALHGWDEIIEKITSDESLDLNTPDSSGATPLDLSFNKLHPTAAKILIQKLSKESIKKSTTLAKAIALMQEGALHFQKMTQMEEIIQIILDSNKFNCQSPLEKGGITPIQWVTRYGTRTMIEQMIAAEKYFFPFTAADYEEARKIRRENFSEKNSTEQTAINELLAILKKFSISSETLRHEILTKKSESLQIIPLGTLRLSAISLDSPKDPYQVLS